MIPKRIFSAILLLVSVFLMISCSKDDGPDKSNQYYFRFKLNGELKDYSGYVKSQYYNNGMVDIPVDNSLLSSRVLSRQNADPFSAESTNSFLINFLHKEKIVANKTYSNYGPEALQNDDFFSLGYIDQTGVAYVGTYHPASILGQAGFTFTEITATHLKGTFSGALVKASGESVTITEGEFYVPRYMP